MDLQERLSYLETVRDWQGLVDELEKAIAASKANTEKAAYHLRLGRVLESKFLLGVKALKHFQDAYKLNPQLTESLAAARHIYWDLGKLNMVQKLLELELKSLKDSPEASDLLLELGDVLCDTGDFERAAATYARALAASGGKNLLARAALEDAQVEAANWKVHVGQLGEQADRGKEPGEKGRALLRAARVARRFAPDEVEAFLGRAYAADPASKQVGALYEGLLADKGMLDVLEAAQSEILGSIEDRRRRGHVAMLFGNRWVSRHQNTDLGAKFLEMSVKLDTENEGAFSFLGDVLGRKGGDWDRVLTLAEEAASHAGSSGNATFLFAQAGTIAWRQLGNLIRARANFERLCAVSPDHPQLRAFEAQIGEELQPPKPGSGRVEGLSSVLPEIRPRTSPPSEGVPAAARAPSAPVLAATPATYEEEPPRARRDSIPESAPPTPVVHVEVAPNARPSIPEPAPVSQAASSQAASGNQVAASVSGSESPARIAELRALADKQEQAKRFNEYVKTLLQLAAAVPETDEKVRLLMKAADLYVTKFANQAEAVKAFEQVIALEPDNGMAADYLRQMYEKRRDWEKLLVLQKRDAERLDPGPQRAARFLEIAKLATERIKKPEVCIDLWREVLKSDEGNAEALGALAGLYERSKDFDALTQVLEKQAEVTYDNAARAVIFGKLGTIYGDRLNNDDGAVRAWSALLAIDPNDRKAQEALKKKYLALGRWDDLEIFYAESGKWDEFIRVLEQQEAKEPTPEAKVGLLFKIAQLWADKKQKSDRAAKAYEKILDLSPGNLQAADALIPIYQQVGNPKALSNVLEVKLSHEDDGVQKLALLREVAALYEGRVKDPQKALERYLTAFELFPQDEQAASDVERAGKAAAGWDRVVASYRAAIERAIDGGDRGLAVDLRLRLGRVLLSEVKDVDGALDAYRAVYDADGDNTAAIVALELLYRQTSRFKDLLEIYEKRRDMAGSAEDKKAINYEIARLYETELRDVDKAVDTYNLILEDEPGETRALSALDVLYRGLERWEPYVETLRRRIELDAEGGDLVDLKFRLGQTLAQHLGDAPAALENYREILFLSSQHEGARLALEEMLEKGDQRAEAAAILENIYEERGDWPKLVGALDILSNAEGDIAKRVQLKRKIARISADATGDFPRAFEALASALKDDPSLLDTRGELERIAEAAGSHKALVTLYGSIADDLSDAALARDYSMRLAIINERLGDVDAAAAGYGKVLDLDGADGEALGALEQLFVRTERWSDLIGVVQRRIDQTSDGDGREALYVQTALIYDEKLGKPEQAVEAYKKVLELDPTSPRALAALDALFTRQKMWTELAENLESQLALATADDAQIRLMLRLASLREQAMGQVETAIEGYRTILERDAENGEALAALERLGTDPTHELVIADLLEPLYRQLGELRKLIGVHEVQVRRSEDVTRRVELLHQVAQLHEDAGGDLGAAFTTLARALKEDPGSEGTQQALERVARARGSFAELAQVFQELAGGVSDPALAASLTTMAARVHESDLGDVDVAIQLYDRVLSVDPTALHAAEALERLYRGTQRYAELSKTLQRKADIVDDPAAKKDALFQAAMIEEQVLGQPEAAIAVYGKVSELDPEDLRPIDALIAQYQNLGRFEDLLGVYARKVDLLVDAGEKKRILYEVGGVHEHRVRDVDKAIETYQRVLELDPDDLHALSRLDALYGESENWQELLTVLTRQGEMAPDAAESIRYQYRIAELYERRLGDVPRAVELYREILTQDPGHGQTLQALEGLKDGTQEPVAAAAVLEPVYEAVQDWPRLISVHEVQVKHAGDPFAQVDLLHRIARLHEEALGNPAAAFDTYARALPLGNDNDLTLQSLERLAMVLGRWPDTARLYDRELDKLTDLQDRFVDLGLRVAQVYEGQLEDVDTAVARYRRVLEVDGENQAAIRSLDRLFLQTQRWSELAQILAREAEIGQTPDEVLEFRFRLGQVQEHSLRDLDAAIAAYRDVINAAPDHGATLEALEGLFAAGQKQVEIAEILEPLYRQNSEWEKLARVHEAQLAHLRAEGEGAQEERLAAYYRIAELHEEKLGDTAQAMDTYVRALKEYPLDERAGEDAPRLAAAVDGGWEILANAYADVLGLHGDVQVQRTIGKRLAKTFEDELGDVSKAEETYKYVLSVDELEVEALTQLDRIYASIEAYGELAGILEQRVRATQDTLELVELYARLGEVYETRLGEIEKATGAYRRIFDDLEKTHEGAISALARIYEQQGAWHELNTVYERELENASGDVAEADIRAKIAHLAAERLGEPQRAIDTWKMVLDLRGEDPESLLALSHLYEGGQEWNRLAEILERTFDIVQADDERVNILTRRARVFSDKLGRDDQALEDWNRVLDIDYANLAALRSIAAIRRRQQDPSELVQALHQTVDRASSLLDEEELKEVYRELGKTYGDQLQQPYDAAEAWRKLLEVGPDFEAMDALEGIYRGEERWPDVIDVKMQRADALAEPAEKIDELRSVAALWRDQVADADGARTAYEKILEVDPAHDEAFKDLEILHVNAGRWEPLVELYLARLESREATSDRTELLRKIARVFEEHLGDKNQALDALQNAFNEDIFDRETAKYLERMAQATGRWGEVIQNVNGMLQQEKAADRKIRLCLHLAKWYGDDLGRQEYAQPYYAQIVQLDPNNVGALRQMAQLYRKSANWQQLGATLTRALDVAVADVDRKEILTELGEVLDQQMGQQEQAIGYFQRALEVDGHFVPALENLERIYAARGQNRELVDVLQRKVGGQTELADVANTKLRVAGLYEMNLGDPPKAGAMYREVLDVDPQNLQALRGVARVAEVLQQWPDLVRALEAELDVVQTERERIDVLMKLAELNEEHFLKADIAAQRLEQVLEIDPNNEEAYRALARNYRKLRQWIDLVNTYERHIAATLERRTKVEIYGHIAQVYADEVEDAERAIDAYRNIVDLDDTNVEALDSLAKLYEKQGDGAQAIEYMGRVAELTQDTARRVDAFYKIGKAMDERLGDRVGAQDRYEMALDLDPAHLPSLAALRTIAIDNADYDKAARYIDQEQSYTQAPRQRARLLVELGRIREESLGEHSSAVLAWEAAHEADQENEDAAMPLANEYVATEQWERAEPLLDLLVRKAGKRERQEQHALNLKLGQVATALGKDDKAFKAFSAAHQLDLTDPATLRGLADVCFRMKDWGAALTNFQKVLTSLGEDETEARADVYFKLGAIKREQGQAKQAINNFEKALGVDAAHKPTLEAMVSLYGELKDWKQVVAYKRAILDSVYDGEERFRILNEIADVWSDNDKSPLKAIEALEEAKDLQPQNLPLLHKTLALYQSTENWSKMIDTIQAISEMEKDPIRKSKFLYTIAQLYRDKEDDQDRAVDLFNEVLDLNPTYLEAFERINKILTTKKDWKGLERAYRKMLRRLSAASGASTTSPNADLEFNLWHQLGLIYRDRLGDMNSAIEAFKMATRFKPDEAVERQILAELYEATGQMDAAIGEHAIVLQRDPLRVDPYRSLHKLYSKTHEYDRAWCMCAALAFLHKADEEEQRFFEDYRPRGMIQVKSRLDNEQWVKNLFHKDENIFIGKIFEMITPAAIVAKTTQLRATRQLPNLDKRFKQDPATSTVTFAKTFGWAAQVLGVPLPDLYVRNDVPGALVAVPSSPPSSVAGQTVLTGFTPQELTFIVGKHLAYYRGEHYIRNLFPTLNELKVLLFAAIKIILADFNVPPEMAQAVNTTAQELAKYMQPIQRDSLRLVVNKFMEDGARADLKRWMQTIEVTATRAGLLLCADLEIAKKIIAAEPQLPGDLSPQDKMKELIVFSVSEQYFALRKALGINVG